MPSSEPLSIAIIGGGIAGLSLAIGLIRHGQAVVIYEAAARFGEIGAGVMFGPNAIRAMGLIDPQIEDAIRRISNLPSGPSTSAPRCTSSVLDFRHAYHPSTGASTTYEYVGSSVPKEGSLVPASRAAFLEELVRLVPAGVARFNRRVTEVAESEDGWMELSFKDGSTARHRVVLGADGIHSRLRGHVLGPHSPNREPVWAKEAGWRGRVPVEKAVEVLGEELAYSNTLFMGMNSHISYYCVGGAKFVNMTPMYHRETWEHDEWVVPSSREEVHEAYKGWPQPILDLLDQIDYSTVRGLYHLPETETYYRGQTAIIGDAAHATTPFQGSGAGMAIEDAYVLSALLGPVRDVAEVESALAAYDAVRRPRGHRLVKTSVEAATIFNYRDPDLGFDWKEIGENVAGRWKWIWEEDLQGEVKEGRKLMAQSRQVQ